MTDGSGGALLVYDESGMLRFKRNLPAPPEGVSVSADGMVVAANVRAFAKVFDAMTGAMRDSIPISGETQRPALLSGDGSLLLTGGFSRTVNLYQWNGTDYASLWSYPVPGTTWITALAISDDGSTVAAGTWTNPTGGKVLLFNSSSSTPLWTDAAYGDWISGVALTTTGSVLAAGSWGRYAGTVYNIVSVYNRASGVPTTSIADDAYPGVGSCMAIDISEDGHYVLVGGKAVHAREMGSGGYVMAIELQDPAAVENVPHAPRLTASPNPFAGSVQFAVGGLAAGTTVDVLTADGRHVRTVALHAGSATWDGLDENGREVPAGAYFVRASGDDSPTTRIVRIR